MGYAMTPDRIQEEIQWLKDDICSCRYIVQSTDASSFEKAEYRRRIMSDRHELARLESTQILIQSDPLFQAERRKT